MSEAGAKQPYSWIRVIKLLSTVSLGIIELGGGNVLLVKFVREMIHGAWSYAEAAMKTVSTIFHHPRGVAGKNLT